MADRIRINGNPHDWGSTQLKIGIERYYGVTAIGWDEARTRVLVYGSGRDHAPRGITNGKYEPGKLKLTCEKATAKAIKDQLANLANDGVSYGNAKVPICLQFVEFGQDVIVEDFDDCAIVSDSNQNEESGDPTKEEIEFQFLRHRTNGQSLYNQAG